MATQRSGGAILVDALKINGADMAFCVPGESYLEALDALYDVRDSIRLITCRQEGGVSYMAEAYGKVTGRPGIAFVTRGPGVTHAAVGVHTARQDSTPMIVLVGQIARSMRDREAFQEIDISAVFGTVAKWATQIEEAARIPEYIARAFHVATSGRPGPVVIGLPEDMLIETAAVDDVRAAPAANASPPPPAIARLRELLAKAKRPLAILGGSGWTEEARRDVGGFLERSGIPVTCAFRRQHLFDNRSAYYAGDIGIGAAPALLKRAAESDLIIAIGTRLSEATSQGYTSFVPPRTTQPMIHVHADPDELGRVYQADLPINAAMPEFGAALAAMPPVDGSAWAGWTREAHAGYEEARTTGHEPATVGAFVDLTAVMRHLDEILPDDATFTCGAGNFAGWLNRYYRFRTFATQIGPTNGSMGYSVPAAIAAKLVHPERVVIAWCGDGEFMMTGHEMATAAAHGAHVIAIVVNNGMYGTIRMHQERDHPRRVIGTDLANPDFALLARAYHAHPETVLRTGDFPAAFERARAAGRPAIIELRTNPDVISTRGTISAMHAGGAAR